MMCARVVHPSHVERPVLVMNVYTRAVGDITATRLVLPKRLAALLIEVMSDSYETSRYIFDPVIATDRPLKAAMRAWIAKYCPVPSRKSAWVAGTAYFYAGKLVSLHARRP